jgi:hypothetical protein
VRQIDDQMVGWTALSEDVPLRQLVVVPVDVGKSSAVVMACEFTRRTLMPAVEFPSTRTGVAGMLAGLRRALAGRHAAGPGWGGSRRALSPADDQPGGVAGRLAAG